MTLCRYQIFRNWHRATWPKLDAEGFAIKAFTLDPKLIFKGFLNAAWRSLMAACADLNDVPLRVLPKLTMNGHWLQPRNPVPKPAVGRPGFSIVCREPRGFQAGTSIQ